MSSNGETYGLKGFEKGRNRFQLECGAIQNSDRFDQLIV